MIYVVGTGRCGTGSMAVKLKGLHEPNPRLNIVFRLKYDGMWDETDQTWLEYALEKRSKLDAPAISDFYQSLFIKDIVKIDSTAEFIWLIRERSDCIRSMSQRRENLFWKTQDLASDFYDKVNSVIEKSLQGLKFTKTNTEDIGEPKVNTLHKPLAGIDFT